MLSESNSNYYLKYSLNDGYFFNALLLRIISRYGREEDTIISNSSLGKNYLLQFWLSPDGLKFMALRRARRLAREAGQEQAQGDDIALGLI